MNDAVLDEFEPSLSLTNAAHRQIDVAESVFGFCQMASLR